MPELTLPIINVRGLHARASAKFAAAARGFDAEIKVSKDDYEVDAESLMGLMMLAAGPGSEILVRAEGPEAQAALAALAELVGNKFGEDD
jgi:phosphocarrier protein HPr